MLKKEYIEKMPSSIREEITNYLKQCIEKAEKQKNAAALSFTLTTDEAQRASSLISQGEINAFTALYNVFK